MIFLRNYTSVAHQSHFCNCCCRHILPGEQYEGNVYATNKNGIIVAKQHMNPPCDFPWDEEEELFALGKSKNLESSVKEDEPLTIAA